MSNQQRKVKNGKFWFKFQKERVKPVKSASLSVIVAIVLLLAGLVSAEPPLPCTNIEGNSGVGITSTAYLANPPKEGEVFGKPSVSALTVFGREKNLQSFTVTENILGKYEIGYAYERFGLGD